MASCLRALSLSFYLLWAALVLVIVKSEKDLAWLFKAYLVAGLLAAIAAPIYYLGLRPVHPFAQPWGFPTGNRDFLAGLLLIPLGITFSRIIHHTFIKKDWKQGLIFSGLGAFFLIIFYFTGSKAAAVALAVVFFVVLLFILPHRARVALFLSVLIIIGSALVIYKTLPAASGWLHSRYAYRSLLQRCYFWDWSLRMFAQRPFLGWGAGTFVAANGPFSSIDRFRYLHQERPYFLFADFIAHSHNEFLEVLVELGLLGLGVYLFLLFWVGAKGVAGSKKITMATTRFSLYGLLAGFIGLCVQSLFSVGLRYWDLAPYFWTCVGALLAAGSLGKRERCRGGVPSPPVLEGEPGDSPLHLRWKKVRLVLFLILVSSAIFFWYQIVWKGFRAEMHLYRADILRRSDKYAQAVPYYRKARDNSFIYADLLRGQYDLGRVLFKLGRWPEARETLKRVNSLARDFIHTNLLLGEVYEHLGEKEKALIFYRRYQRQNPYDSRTLEKIEALIKEMKGADVP